VIAYGKSYYRLLIGNHTLARLVPLLMTLNDIWRFEGHFTLPCPISRKLYRIRPQKLKLLIRNQTFAYRWYECRWLDHVSRSMNCLIHIKFLVNGALYGKSYYRVLIGSHILAFDWYHFDDLEVHLKVISFQPRLSFQSINQSINQSSAGLTHKRTKRALRAPSCKGAPSKTGRKLIK